MNGEDVVPNREGGPTGSSDTVKVEGPVDHAGEGDGQEARRSLRTRRGRQPANEKRRLRIDWRMRSVAQVVQAYVLLSVLREYGDVRAALSRVERLTEKNMASDVREKLLSILEQMSEIVGHSRTPAQSVAHIQEPNRSPGTVEVSNPFGDGPRQRSVPQPGTKPPVPRPRTY